MALKAGFGEYSLPPAIRNELLKNYPMLPRSFVNGLRAISKAAFTGSNDEQMARFNRAMRILKTADYYAPEFYLGTNSNLPDHLLTVLAGEAELEYSEDLDKILPDEALALLREFRAISQNSSLLYEPDCTHDARFLSLIRLYTEMEDYLDMLHTGEMELGGDERTASLKQNNHLRENILNAGDSKLEKNIFDTLRRIDMIHQFGLSDSMWQMSVTRNPDFGAMSEGELLDLSDIPSSDALEIVFGIGLKARMEMHELNRLSAFAMMADMELSAIREICKHFDNINPAVLCTLLIGKGEGHEEVVEVVINVLGPDGEDIAYMHSAQNDPVMLATLPKAHQDILDAYNDCVNINQMEWHINYLAIINTYDPDYVTAKDQLLEILNKVEERLNNNPPTSPLLLKALSDSFKRADTAYTLARFLDWEEENIPPIDHIDQKMTQEEIRDYMSSFTPANS